MSERKITENQINFIKKLIKNKENENILSDYLKKVNKKNIEDLSIKEASEIIELLKNSMPSSEVPYATGKQITLIEKLQENEDAERLTQEYLKEKNKETINFLNIKEASELIDKLKETSPNTSKKDKKITEKQLQYLMKLIKDDEKRKIAFRFLTALNKNSFDELTSKEASLLIDKLK